MAIAFLIRCQSKSTKSYMIGDEEVSILTSSPALRRTFEQLKDLCSSPRKAR